MAVGTKRGPMTASERAQQKKDKRRFKDVRDALRQMVTVSKDEGRGVDASMARRAIDTLNVLEMLITNLRARAKRYREAFALLDLQHNFLKRKHGLAMSGLDVIELVLSGKTMYKSKDEQIEFVRNHIKAVAEAMATVDKEEAEMMKHYEENKAGSEEETAA